MQNHELEITENTNVFVAIGQNKPAGFVWKLKGYSTTVTM
jgi:hypothetical protein